MEQKFYICKHCGNIIAKVKDTGVPVICCGEPMSEIIPGTTDAAVEKHVPVWTVEEARGLLRSLRGRRGRSGLRLLQPPQSVESVTVPRMVS